MPPALLFLWIAWFHDLAHWWLFKQNAFTRIDPLTGITKVGYLEHYSNDIKNIFRPVIEDWDRYKNLDDFRDHCQKIAYKKRPLREKCKIL